MCSAGRPIPAGSVAGHVVACAMPIQPVRAFAVQGAVLALCLLGCGRDRSAAHHDQDEYVADVVAFTGATEPEVRDRIAGGEARMKTEWEA